MPIKLVRLDTAEARTAAATGKLFQITVVPTMVVIYEDGNLQMFVGAEKITQWLSALGRRISQSQVEQHPEEDNDTNIPQERPAPPPPRQPTRRAAPTSTVVVEDDSSDESYEERATARHQPKPRPARQAPQRAPPRAPKAATPPKISKKKGKGKKKKPTVRFDDADGEDAVTNLELIDGGGDDEIEVDVDPGRAEARQKLNAAMASKTKKTTSRMKSVYDMAKQMEQARTASLGYNESELPRF